MLTYEDLIALYGEEHVHRCPPVALEQVDLPSEAKVVVSQVGLPDEGAADFASYLAHGQRLIPLFGRIERWCCFGTTASADLCIRAKTGEVWKLWPNERYPDVFVNSSLGAFVEFQYLFDRMCRQDTGQNDARIRHAAQEMEEAWRGLDPRALADDGNHWARWLDDTKMQLGMSPYDE